jgi:hypothetical protein
MTAMSIRPLLVAAVLVGSALCVGPERRAGAAAQQAAQGERFAGAGKLTMHEAKTFEEGQTVYVSGQAFVRCKFVGCTLVLRESIYHLEGCTFERCNWHLDWLVGWGDRDGVRELKALVTLLEKAQQEQLR